MAGGKYAQGQQHSGNGRYDLPAYGNTDSWHDDDMRVAVIILLMALGWIYLKLRGKDANKGWLEALGVGFGENDPPGFASLEELVEALKGAGVSKAGLIVGVDFTRSNEWTGERVYGNGSMHEIDDRKPNPYQEVLRGVGRGLGPLNRAEKIWCYGFGDENTRDEAVFCFMADDQPCANLAQALDRYASIAPAVSLSGPTSFAPLIRKAIEIVQDTREYHCLVIIADGQVTKERDTVRAIQDASNYPLSIIMVGVGEGPWETCREFDNRLPGRRYDNFRFVEHRRLKYGDAEALALSALAEVPDQYRAIRALGIMEGAGAPGSGPTSVAASVAGGGVSGSAPSMAPVNMVMSGSAPPSAPPSELDEDEGVPQDFICPLTLEVMIDPVVCEDGHSYERGALEAWLRNHDTSPMSNAHLNSKMAVPNHALRNSIEAFRRERGY
ncbi:unnamed protein product [Ectocarpus sp. CCAP 1310/34]|nr:unnamed protein product [Ectocarpus sp. CCAP 1310/34]